MNDRTKKNDIKKIAPIGIFQIVGCSTLFVCLFLYLYKIVFAALIYQKYALDPWITPFEPGLVFFKSFLGKPGNILSYFESFLFQWYYFNLSASVVTVLLALSAFLALYSLLAIFKTRGRHVLAYGPAIAIAVMYNIYDNMLYSCLGVTLSLIFAVIYTIIAPQKALTRMLIFAIIFSLLYYIAASFSLIFVLLVAIYDATITRRTAVVFAELMIACTTIFLIGILACDMPLKDAFLHKFSFGPWASPLSINISYAMCGLILLTALLSGLWSRFVPNKAANNTQATSTKFVITALQLTVVVTIGVLALHFSFNQTNKTFLMSKYLARHSMWNELIELGQKNPELHKYIFFNHDHTRALFHTDRLESELFKYPQSVDAMLLSAEEVKRSREYYEKASGIMLSLGYANGTEINSYELLEGSGNWPLVLESLAIASLAKGQDQTATVFLNKLSKDILQGKTARDILQQFHSDPTLSDNKRIKHLRSISVIEEDLPKIGDDTNDFYRCLLRKNPKNKMAFQYMMAEYLLKEEIHQIAENIYRLEDFGYDKLPRYYEEALVIETQMNGKINIPKKWKPSAKALQQGQEFLNIYAIYKQDKARARKILAAEYGDSYYFYFMLN